MKWLPYEEWEVRTPVDVPTLAEGLRKRIAPLKVLRQIAFWRDDVSQGKVTSDGFVFYPAAIYRWYDSPVISGRFTASPTGTTIRMNMTLHSAGAYGLVIGIVLLVLCAVSLVQKGQWVLAALLLVAVPSSGGITRYRYGVAAPKAKQLISLYIAGIEREAAGR